MKCDAYHDGHDCRERDACTRALVAMLERSAEREREESSEYTVRAVRDMVQ